jgi:hypothetical protein
VGMDDTMCKYMEFVLYAKTIKIKLDEKVFLEAFLH